MAVDAAERAPRDEHERRQERARRDERAAGAETGDQAGSRDRADRHARRRPAEQHAQHAAEHVVADQALQQRLAGDVLDRVADPDDREQHQRSRSTREYRDERDRDAPEHEPEPERGRQPPPRQRNGGGAADDDAGADGSREQADPASARMEQPERDHDDQNVQGAAHDRLRDEERDDQARLRLACEQPEAVGEPALRTVVREAQPALDPDRRERQRGHDVRDRPDHEHDSGVGGGDERAREQRPDERAQPLERQ